MRETVIHLLIIVFVSSIVFFLNLGQSRLWDRDEPRNAGCAIEMMDRGDLVVPTFNDELRHQKPVLLYWLMMTAYSMFGVSEFSARFWSALLGNRNGCRNVLHRLPTGECKGRLDQRDRVIHQPDVCCGGSCRDARLGIDILRNGCVDVLRAWHFSTQSRTVHLRFIEENRACSDVVSRASDFRSRHLRDAWFWSFSKRPRRLCGPDGDRGNVHVDPAFGSDSSIAKERRELGCTNT